MHTSPSFFVALFAGASVALANPIADSVLIARQTSTSVPGGRPTTDCLVDAEALFDAVPTLPREVDRYLQSESKNPFDGSPFLPTATEAIEVYCSKMLSIGATATPVSITDSPELASLSASYSSASSVWRESAVQIAPSFASRCASVEPDRVGLYLFLLASNQAECTLAASLMVQRPTRIESTTDATTGLTTDTTAASSAASTDSTSPSTAGAARETGYVAGLMVLAGFIGGVAAL
ncbi:hypothetical protein QBC35DRAFT_547754 [Podospora australis]|uniref:Infection structure specific protein n=1 Tax=Podospora australis TaxID=1536484 RepID=A0AAN6WJ91_9PEZI|nr:hypothetical protein QBC35DRAFT_547754 [Podospora australis]